MALMSHCFPEALGRKCASSVGLSLSLQHQNQGSEQRQLTSPTVTIWGCLGGRGDTGWLFSMQFRPSQPLMEQVEPLRGQPGGKDGAEPGGARQSPGKPWWDH